MPFYLTPAGIFDQCENGVFERGFCLQLRIAKDWGLVNTNDPKRQASLNQNKANEPHVWIHPYSQIWKIKSDIIEGPGMSVRVCVPLTSYNRRCFGNSFISGNTSCNPYLCSQILASRKAMHRQCLSDPRWPTRLAHLRAPNLRP